MTATAFLTVWEGNSEAKPEYLGKYDFASLPSKDERIIIPGAGPWWDILLVLNVTHRALKTDTPAIGRFEPGVEIFVKRIGEEDDD